MGLLSGKNIVITGVLTDASLAFGVAKLAQEEGAEIVLTGAGRALSLTERVARVRCRARRQRTQHADREVGSGRRCLARRRIRSPELSW
jgi:enoyl-[acyl-carrier-protein] reductase (NADH)